MRFLTICVLFRVLKRLEEEEGGGTYGYRLCDTPNEAKESDRKCALTQLSNKKHDSITFSIRITFEQVLKQRLQVKKSIKRLLNAIFWLDF